MAKAKTTINAPKVPNAEPVGDLNQFKTASSGEAASTELLPLVEATATGVAAPVATHSSSNEPANGDAVAKVSSEPATAHEVSEATGISAVTDQDNIVTDIAGSDLASETQEQAGGFSKEIAGAIRSQILGIPSPDEKREFYVLSPVRHNNIRYGEDETIILSETEHAQLYKKQIVEAWDNGLGVD